jgi:hypothetical protein
VLALLELLLGLSGVAAGPRPLSVDFPSRSVTIMADEVRSREVGAHGTCIGVLNNGSTSVGPQAANSNCDWE